MENYNELFLATTDTVVGIGGPVNAATKRKINLLKQSSVDKRLVILVSSVAMAKKEYSQVGFDQNAETLAKKYWPGPYTLVCSEELALRMPNQKQLLALIDKLGPIYMTSANFSGQNPLSFAKAKILFNKLGNYYDFGPGSGKSSTIIDVKTLEVLR